MAITAQRFRRARLALGLSQLEVAQMIGVRDQTISNFERGITGSLKKPEHQRKMLELINQAEASVSKTKP